MPGVARGGARAARTRHAPRQGRPHPRPRTRSPPHYPQRAGREEDEEENEEGRAQVDRRAQERFAARRCATAAPARAAALPTPVTARPAAARRPDRLTSRVHVARAARVVLAGGVIAYPTEAVFGLGCLPENRAAVERVLAIKRRLVAQRFAADRLGLGTARAVRRAAERAPAQRGHRELARARDLGAPGHAARAELDQRRPR